MISHLNDEIHIPLLLHFLLKNYIYHFFLLRISCMGVPTFASQADAMVSEGYLRCLLSDGRKQAYYWNGMLGDFPNHPLKNDAGLSSCIGCTLYGTWEPSC